MDKQVMKETTKGLCQVVKKHLPEIMFVAGTLFVGSGVVVACTETLKIEPIVTEHENAIVEAEENAVVNECSKSELGKEKAHIYLQTGWKLAKNYAGSAALVLAGIGCYGASYGVLKERNAAAVAAFNGIQAAYTTLQDRVRKELGEEKAKELEYGVTKELVEKEYVDEKTGKTKKTKEELKYLGEFANPYAFIFDKVSCYGTATDNRNYDICQAEAIRNVMGVSIMCRDVYLNELYDAFGHCRIRDGQFNGWEKGTQVKFDIDEPLGPNGPIVIVPYGIKNIITNLDNNMNPSK